MADRNGRSRGELAKAELTVQELEGQLEHVRTLIHERRSEKQGFGAQSQAAAAAGDVNRLVAIENRSVVVDKTIHELAAAEVECAERVEAARRYLFTLYVRLEKLRKEARELMRRIESIENPEGEVREVQTSLSRVKVQIKAIVGEVQTGPLLTGLGAK